MTRIVTFTDCETTGLLDKDHRIIELTCGMFDLDTEAEVKMATYRIDPLRRIDPRAQKVHGITNDDVAGKPTFDVIAPKLVTAFNASTLIVAHNGLTFDKPFYEMECARVGQRLPARQWFDTCEEGRGATPYGTIPSLKLLCQCLDVEYDDTQAHGAEYDTRILAQCFFEGRRIGMFPSFERLAA